MDGNQDASTPSENPAIIFPVNQSVSFEEGSAVLEENIQGTQETNARPGTEISSIVADAEELAQDLPQRVSSPLKSPILSPLETELRTSLQRYDGEPEYKFLPIDAFDNTVQVENITRELDHPNRGGYDSNSMANEIMGTIEEVTGRQRWPKRRIFAILVLMAKSRKITQFIDAKVSDHQLPFKFRERENGLFEVKDTYDNVISVEMFKKRSPCEGFRNHQWKVLAPYFDLSLKCDDELNHYDLNLYPGLPFLENKQIHEGLLELNQGGYAQVRRVMIHAAHHNAASVSQFAPGTVFAVKRLRLSEAEYRLRGEAKNYEAEVLKRLNNIDHDHIIRLLGTFSYGGHFHMIFPWADGNLQDLWKSCRPDSDHARATGALAHWLCKQIVGLTNALTNVHDMQRAERNAQNRLTSFDSRTHGRHGDIKPENILWFRNRDPAVQGSLGVLKLADFGLADFHSKFSHSGANAKGVTDTYQAPEIEIIKVVSQKYDMWSLGCVVMEFIVWYIDGWEGVDSFSQRRESESASSIGTDLFYNVSRKERRSWNILRLFRKVAEPQKDWRAEIKPSVAGIQRFLTEEPRTSIVCSDFAMDMLYLIQDDLLRMDPHKRATCDYLVQKLSIISNSCLEDPKYCTELRRPVRKKATHRSELSSSGSLPEPNKRRDGSRLVFGRNTVGLVATDTPGIYVQSSDDENRLLTGDMIPNSSVEENQHPQRLGLQPALKALYSCLCFKDTPDA